jgi:D-alanyl-D-alanine dipeptidase
MPCLVKTATALKLRKAQEILKTRGLGLRIWDAWRPPEVQVLLVEADGNTGLFMDPKSAWSRHCSGTAVDVTVVDLKGREQPMPSYHDEGGPAAHYLYQGSEPQIKRNLHCLQRAMFDAGFIILDTEWWHFDDSDFYTVPTPVVFGNQVGIHLAQNP